MAVTPTDTTLTTVVDQVLVIIACMRTADRVPVTGASTETTGRALANLACMTIGLGQAMAVFMEMTGLALVIEASTTRADLVLAMEVTEEPTSGICEDA